MAFRKNNDSIKAYCTGTVGGKIRQLRELRNLSMKELGVKCGFPVSSADVRIVQYESDKRKPTSETLRAIADALRVPVSVFSGIGEADSTGRLFSILFELEDQCGLHPYYSDGGWCVRFENIGAENLEMMRKWDKAYRELVLKKHSRVAYDIWKAESLPELKRINPEHEDVTPERLARAQKDLDEFRAFLEQGFEKENAEWEEKS